MGFPVVQASPPRLPVLMAVAGPRSGLFSSFQPPTSKNPGALATYLPAWQRTGREGPQISPGRNCCGSWGLHVSATWGLFVILQFPPRRPRDPRVCPIFSFPGGRALLMKCGKEMLYRQANFKTVVLRRSSCALTATTLTPTPNNLYGSVHSTVRSLGAYKPRRGVPCLTNYMSDTSNLRCLRRLYYSHVHFRWVVPCTSVDPRQTTLLEWGNLEVLASGTVTEDLHLSGKPMPANRMMRSATGFSASCEEDQH